MSLDLPFHYWTLNERFRDFHDEMPSFDDGGDDDDDDDDGDPQNHPLRLHRLRMNRQEDGSVFVPGQSFLPARNQTSIRHRIFRPSAALPPVGMLNLKRFADFFFNKSV